MKIILFTHPQFLGSESMPRFAEMIREGMLERGHEVEVWSPKSCFYKLSFPFVFRKWLGYVDQFIVFPFQVKQRLRRIPSDILFVFTDHALGPWVPLVANRKHVIHCHDFLALRSALGEFSEHKTSWTGKIYQNYIRRGFEHGKQFITISNKTAEDLRRLNRAGTLSVKVVYNGLNYPFSPMDKKSALNYLSRASNTDLENGYILNVSGSQWYKNREGLLGSYIEYHKTSEKPLPLVVIGAKPSEANLVLLEKNNLENFVHFLIKPENEIVHAAYSAATVFFFPSLEEGFGWPIIEAQASGCPVITTDAAPMTEVGGGSVIYLPRRIGNDETGVWKKLAAAALTQVASFSSEERKDWIQKGFKNIKRFDTEAVMDQYEAVYEEILEVAQ